MKRFLIRIVILLLIVLVADNLIGYGLDHIVSNIKVGGQGRDNYIAEQSEEDVLVFGSSRAVHHYNTPMLEDSLGMVAYNCGDDGAGIILSYARLLMIKERHKPQIIIQDVCSEFDVLKGDNHKYLGWLRTHYDKEFLRPIFNSIDETEKYKMMCHLYRYNSKFLQNIFVYLTGQANDGGFKGYRPIHGNLDKMKIKTDVQNHGEYVYDSLKLDYTQRFIDLAQGSKLYFVVSPIWYGLDSLQFQPVKEICAEQGIPFIDFSNNPKYVHNDEYFSDGSHLNEMGADEFTKDLIKLIK